MVFITVLRWSCVITRRTANGLAFKINAAGTWRLVGGHSVEVFYCCGCCVCERRLVLAVRRWL